MDSFEFSKIAGAVLAALLLIFGTKVLIEQRLAPHGEDVVGYRLPTETAPAATPDVTTGETAPAAETPAGEAPAPATAASEGAAEPSAPAAPPAAAAGFDAKAAVALVASASVEDGATIYRKCVTCHTNKKDGPSTVAPNMWGIVGRPKASHPDFQAKYSDAMKAKGGDWSFESLAEFVHRPRGYVPGTKMIFAGLNDKGEIANLLAYLRTLADTPAPLPN